MHHHHRLDLARMFGIGVREELVKPGSHGRIRRLHHLWRGDLGQDGQGGRFRAQGRRRFGSVKGQKTAASGDEHRPAQDLAEAGVHPVLLPIDLILHMLGQKPVSRPARQGLGEIEIRVQSRHKSRRAEVMRGQADRDAQGLVRAIDARRHDHGDDQRRRDGVPAPDRAPIHFLLHAPLLRGPCNRRTV